VSVSVIITAGGIGKRMGAVLPKQFMQIREKPVLMYTIERFYHFDPSMQLIVTLPETWVYHWEDLIHEFEFRIPHRVVLGGEERYHSIKNALDYCHGNYIAIHDGVRPLVSEETLENCLTALQSHKAVIPVIPLKESIRRLDGEQSAAVDRSHFVLVQTPQCFESSVLKAAYEQPYGPEITDDACLVEANGIPIYMVPGNEENIKITTQVDFSLADYLLR
jgi:2-C-methyl-D-erythritol 4-phosphate cytidylyltransferase